MSEKEFVIERKFVGGSQWMIADQINVRTWCGSRAQAMRMPLAVAALHLERLNERPQGGVSFVIAPAEGDAR